MEKKIAVIGLGYVGLPLAVEFAKKYPVIGFDISHSRVDELNSGHDSTLEVSDENLKSVLNNEENQRYNLRYKIEIDMDNLSGLYPFFKNIVSIKLTI